MDEIKTKAPASSGVFDHLQEKVDIFVPSIVKSTTEIIISDASTDLNRIYAEVSGRTR